MTATNQTFPPLLRNGAFWIDNSTFETLPQCKRMAYYRLVFQRHLAGNDDALNFGSACHAGLDARYRQPGEFATDLIATMQEAALASFVEKPTSGWRTPELACEVLKRYAFEHPIEDFTVLGVELPFACPMGTVQLPERLSCFNLHDDGAITLWEGDYIPIIWTGKIDLPIRGNDQIWVCDHKTTSIFGPTYFDQYLMSGQMMGYCWAYQQLTKQRVRGVMINVLAINKPAARTGESNIRFGRQVIPYESYQIDEWQTNTLQLIGDFLSSLCYVSDGVLPPMETTACISKYHRKCDFFGVCTLPPNQRELYLGSGDYSTPTWSPISD